ncbi:MAG: amidohydrolase [Clostridia bacterium]|nr:amidohydrolase [Clostridia bacterium]
MINGTYTVIDAHCHIYPDKIAERAVAGTDRFYDTHAVCRGTLSDLKAQGAKEGIDHFVVQSVATTPKQVKGINEFIAESVVQANGLLTGLGTVHPDSADQDGDVHHIMELGLHGVKIHPDIQQCAIDDPRFMRVYELCEENGLPILMHTGDYRYDFSNPNHLLPVLKRFPKLTIVGAHFGGWSVWEDAARELAGIPNLYVDCSSTFPFLKDVEKVQTLVERFGADRVLFGTDYPMWALEPELKNFWQLRLSDRERRMILSENAIKIFSISL